jgi:hypothetical protein
MREWIGRSWQLLFKGVGARAVFSVYDNGIRVNETKLIVHASLISLIPAGCLLRELVNTHLAAGLKIVSNIITCSQSSTSS